MTLDGDMIGLTASLALAGFGLWRERRYVPGRLPLIPPFFLMFTGVLGVIVFGADLVALTTGVSWNPGYHR